MPQSSLMVAEGKIVFALDPDSVRRGVEGPMEAL